MKRLLPVARLFPKLRTQRRRISASRALPPHRAGQTLCGCTTTLTQPISGLGPFVLISSPFRCPVDPRDAPFRLAGFMTTDTSSHGAPPLSAAARSSLYFEAATPAPARASRMLLISYTFPPDPAVGGLRWQQMAGYFAEQGWAVDVIARDFLRVEDLDTARLERLPPGTNRTER